MPDRKKILVHTIIFTVLMLALILFVYHFNVPNPNMILITALVLSTSIGGAVPGAVCAVLMLVYSLYFFSTNHSFTEFTELNLQKIGVITIGIIINYISVALLKNGRDKAKQQMLSANEALLRANEALEKTNGELKQANELLEETASKDALTGLRNRYALRQDSEMYTGIPLHVLFLDLDDFKAINDTKGHAYGDQVLISVGRTLSENFRTANCYRYGGDEFLVISENEQDTKFAQACNDTKAMLESSGISFSGGYVSGVPDSVSELKSMIIQADELLYNAKEEGKNRFIGGSFKHDYTPGQEVIARRKSHRESSHNYNR